MKIKKYIGDKKFYKECFKLIIPVAIQLLILSIASYIDSLMVNNYDPLAFTGVSSINKMIFVAIFFTVGISSGISIFLSQFLGANDKKKIVGTLQLSVILIIIFGLFLTFTMFYSTSFTLKMFLNIDEKEQRIAYNYGMQYGKVISLFASFLLIKNMIATALRALKKPTITMFAGVVGVMVNISLNLMLIYGIGIIKPMGTKGAAIATVLSSLFEIIIMIIYSLFFSKDKYIIKMFKKIYINKFIIKSYLRKGIFVIFDETLWAIGMILSAKFITMKNISWINSYNYAVIITDLFFVIFGAMASATGVIIGIDLGANQFEKAKNDAKKLIVLMFILSFGIIILMLSFSPLFLLLLTEKNNIYYDSYYLIIIVSFALLLYSFNHMAYFILSAGGDSLRAFLSDQYPTYFIGLPMLYLIYSYHDMLNINVVYAFLIYKILDVIKLFVYYYGLKKNKWLKNITK